MPVVLLERIPLPSLRTYTSVSVLLLACALYYAHQIVTGNFDEATNETDVEATGADGVIRSLSKNETNRTLDGDFIDDIEEDDGYVYGMMRVMRQEFVWVLVNMAYCCLILFGKLIQKAVFGKLRVSEQQHMKDKFWNFVFYKFIFVFGVMNVQTMEEVVLWCAWFSLLGFLGLLAQLCKDRFEYLSFSPMTPAWTHMKVLGLLMGLQFMCVCLLAVSVMVGYMYAGPNTFGFMAAECILLFIKTLHVITRYAIHLVDLNHDGVWENRALYMYYTELVFELSALSVDFAHHLHMLLWSNIFLSMASLVICLQLRYLFYEFQRRIRRHKNYLHVVNSMEAKFPVATKEEVESNDDDCAICWEKMESARKLPCGHLFHNACLRSWLEQDTSCPTCRTSLGDNPVRAPQPNVPQGAAGDAPDVEIRHMGPHNQMTNHFFHFDGSRYVSWLPSFSVEVTHTHILSNASPTHQAQAHTSQLDNMARQVVDVFPHMPLGTVVDDLRVTRSVELTIENIIEGRLAAPPQQPFTRSLETTGSNTQPTYSSPVSMSTGEGLVQTTSSHTAPSETEPSTSSSQPTIEPAPPSSRGSVSLMAQLNFFQEEGESESTDSSSDETPREEFPVVTGYRFSKSSLERENMLTQRKESLLEQARKKFLVKQKYEHPVSSSSSPSTSFSSSSSDLPATRGSQGDRDTAARRRELVYQAVARRIHPH